MRLHLLWHALCQCSLHQFLARHHQVLYAILAVATIFWAFVSDRFGQRLLIMMTNILIPVNGSILLLTVHSKAALMVGACFVLPGLQPGIGITTAFIQKLAARS